MNATPGAIHSMFVFNQQVVLKWCVTRPYGLSCWPEAPGVSPEQYYGKDLVWTNMFIISVWNGYKFISKTRSYEDVGTTLEHDDDTALGYGGVTCDLTLEGYCRSQARPLHPRSYRCNKGLDSRAQ